MHPTLMKKFDYSSPMQVPKVEKIVINMGVGEAVQNSESFGWSCGRSDTDFRSETLVTRAKKSIAGFKLREGMPIGAK